MRFLVFAGIILMSNVGLFAKTIAEDICKTPVCESAGKQLLANLNKSVDPCVDFYDFACGGWVATHTIPSDKSRYGIFDELDHNLKKGLNDILRQKPTTKTPQSVRYSSDLFKACIDEETIESRGVSPLLGILELVNGWPLSNRLSTLQDWQTSYVNQLVSLGLESIYSITVSADANDTLVNRFYINSPNFGLGRNQLVNTSAYPDIVNAYKKYILESVVLLGGKNDSQTQQDIEDMLRFESKLANLSLPQEEKRDPSVWYKRMTFTKLNELTDNKVDWLKLANNIYERLNLPIRVQTDELVIVQDSGYVKGVTELMDKTPAIVVSNYMSWMAVMSFAKYTTKKFRETEFQFKKVTEGIQKLTEQEEMCTQTLLDSIQYAVSRLYVDKNFTPKDKQETANLINTIAESYTKLIHESDWLDETTKSKSLDKLNAITKNVGYPDWLLNNDELDKYYQLKQKVDPKKSFEGILYLEQISVIRMFRSLREAVNLTLNWPMPPAMVNAAYEPTQNSITIPAGILKPPFFNSERPVQLNFGAIGLVIGHEFTHGFDDEGSQYDAQGNLKKWWSTQIRKKFEQKADCFVKEYSNIYVPEAKMHLNGKNTLGENIADNGGMRESFLAYQSWVKKHGPSQRLPHVSEYSADQLYFLSHANVWCGMYRKEALINQIEYNPHSPGKYRVNVPVSNFKPFSDTFKCKADSPMNRKDKCILW
ncbi:neprilysin-1-like [Oppia nitens]|uniref:neprilysin-1-like n=1 Tax=Oppia nitens TaxID=1686743 RepID=UPI0023DA394F|nr:neprilysin-1-like [Oppia nitens]